MDYINVPFEIKAHNVSEEDQFFTFVGHGAIFGNVDAGADRIHAGATKESIEERKMSGRLFPCFWAHEDSQAIGVFPVVEEDDMGLKVHGKLPKDDTFVAGRVIPQMKIGSVGQLSIGYRAQEWSFDDQDVRNITKLKIFEISLVSIGMNERALITEMKNLDLKDKKTIRDVEKALKNGVCFSNKDSKAIVAAMKSYGLIREESAEKGHWDGVDMKGVVEGLQNINTMIKG